MPCLFLYPAVQSDMLGPSNFSKEKPIEENFERKKKEGCETYFEQCIYGIFFRFSILLLFMPRVRCPDQY